MSEVSTEKINVVTVRRLDGYKEDFNATEVRFGTSFLWMRLALEEEGSE